MTLSSLIALVMEDYSSSETEDTSTMLKALKNMAQTTLKEVSPKPAQVIYFILAQCVERVLTFFS